MSEGTHVTDTGSAPCHGFRGSGGGKGWRESGLRGSVSGRAGPCAGGGGVVAAALCSFGKKGLGQLTIAPALHGAGRVGSGVGFFGGVDVAAEGRVLDIKFVIAPF
jgi:hypothetical protein